MSAYRRKDGAGWPTFLITWGGEVRERAVRTLRERPWRAQVYLPLNIEHRKRAQRTHERRIACFCRQVGEK